MTPIVATTDAKKTDGNSAHAFGAFSLRQEHWHDKAKRFNSREWRTIKDWAVQQFNLAISFNQFRIVRLIWNPASGFGALPGMKTITIQDKNANNAPRTLIDIRDAATVELVRKEEQAFFAVFSSLVDVREFGVGVLDENNFGGNPIPWSAEDICRYYEMMYSVWGRKLSICIGGQMGGYTDNSGQWVPPSPIALFFQMFREGGPLRDKRAESEFQDDYGASTWDSQYKLAFGHLGYQPLIGTREVEGNANQWDDNGRDPQALYNEFGLRKYRFLRNMGSWPDYPDTDQFVADNDPSQAVAQLRTWQGQPSQPGPIEPPPGDGGDPDPTPVPYQFPVTIRGGEVVKAVFGGNIPDITYPPGTTETVIPIPIVDGARWNPRVYMRPVDVDWIIDPAEPSGEDRLMSFHTQGRDSAIVTFEGYEEPEPPPPQEWPKYVEHGGPAFSFAKLDPSGPEQGVRLYDWKGGTVVYPFRPDTAAFLRRIADEMENGNG